MKWLQLFHQKIYMKFAFDALLFTWPAAEYLLLNAYNSVKYKIWHFVVFSFAWQHPFFLVASDGHCLRLIVIETCCAISSLLQPIDLWRLITRLTDSALKVAALFLPLTISYMYTYIKILVCVCVCVCLLAKTGIIELPTVLANLGLESLN